MTPFGLVSQRLFVLKRYFPSIFHAFSPHFPHILQHFIFPTTNTNLNYSDYKTDMQKKDTSGWVENSDWRSRYLKYYVGNQRYQNVSQESIAETKRVSFMSNDSLSLSPLIHLKGLTGVHNVNDTNNTNDQNQQTTYPLFKVTPEEFQGHSSSGNDTVLLDMVRQRNQSLKSVKPEEPLRPPVDTQDKEELCDICLHDLNMNIPATNTDRSVSKSRVSRMSTRRDMDIPSILAFTADPSGPTYPQKPQLELAAFQNLDKRSHEQLPRWSIRRSTCPVCSQKWKDRSFISNIKYSGLKKNSSLDMTSITAPGKLKTSLMISYQPRPVVEEYSGLAHSRLKSTCPSWQLIRARKLHMSKPNKNAMNSPPSVTAPITRKELDTRVNKFMSEENIKANKNKSNNPTSDTHFDYFNEDFMNNIL